MTKLRCQDCGSIIDGTKKDIDDSDCECGGSLAILNSEDDSYEPTYCSHCKKEIPGDDENFSCDECDDENLCKDCMVDLEDVSVCKKCVDKAYPRKIETKIEYQDRIVEKPVQVFVDKNGTPLNTHFNPSAKTRFDR